MSSLKRVRVDQSITESNDQPLKRDKSNVRIQPIPEAVFSSYVLPCLLLDELMDLSSSFVCRDWCEWSTNRLVENAPKCSLALRGAYGTGWNVLSRITADHPTWTDEHAYELWGKLVYVTEEDAAGYGESIPIGQSGDVKCSIRWSERDVARRDRMGYIDVSTEITDSNECYDIKLIGRWRDVQIAYIVEYEPDSDTSDDEDDEMADLEWMGKYICFHSLRLTLLQMAELWSKPLDRMRWIRLVILKSDEQRRVWGQLMMFYQEHKRQLRSITCGELKALAHMCLAGRVDKWMRYCENVMRECQNVPISFWNQPLSIKQNDAWHTFVSVEDTERLDAVDEGAKWLRAAHQKYIDEQKRILQERERDRWREELQARLREHNLGLSDYHLSSDVDLPDSARQLLQARICQSYINQQKFPDENGTCPTLDETVQFVRDFDFLMNRTDFIERVSKATFEWDDQPADHREPLEAVVKRCKMESLTACVSAGQQVMMRVQSDKLP